eukprot:TRINITY_DN3450_c0_g1_i2.p1 TRINITY_DN3450_c0_g1~~TRINITY_DN3450_c0_g1_i2.p1  ORF type:complete len:208 (-),score=39.69 TRINITY_DN3450_c0_g1_i2:52-675(-)
MSPSNLAIVFAPNLIAPPSGLGNTIGVMFTNTPQSNELLLLCLTHYEKLLGDLPDPGDELTIIGESKQIKLSTGGTQHTLPTIVVDILRGRNLKIGDRLSRKSDPYVIAYLGEDGGHLKTEIIDKTLDPVWANTFQYTFKNAPFTLKLVCMDYDWNTKDDLIGESSKFNLIDDWKLLEPGDTIQKWIPMDTKGDIEIKVTVKNRLEF